MKITLQDLQIPNSISLEQFYKTVGSTYVNKLKNNNVNGPNSIYNEIHVLNKVYKLFSDCPDNEKCITSG